MINKFITLIILSLLWMQESAAEIDAMELALQHPYQNKQSLHWKNIATEALWLKGVAPEYDSQWQTHVIRLRATEQSSFYLPANESLRLYNPDQNIQPRDIKVYLSNGSGLLTQVEMQASTDGHSLILSPQSTKPQIILLNHPGLKTGVIELAAMVSRKERLKGIAPYRNLKGLSGDWAWLGKKPFQIPEIYWQMQAQQEEVVEVEGPARLALKNRLRYETEASGLIQDYRIRYQLDDSAPIWLGFRTGAETSRRIFVNTLMETLGREQLAYIEIPAGHHRLELMSDRNLYLQVLEQSENDYLLPKLNEPPLTAQTVRKQGLMAEQELPELDALAQDMVRDNSLQSSGLSGSQLLKQAALQHLDNSAALAEANKLLRHHTFYRDLLPTIKYSSGKQFNAYFVNKRLKAIIKPQHDAIVSEQHQSAALKRLGNAYFFSPVASDPGSDVNRLDSYLLPERYAPSVLRIIVDKRLCRERHFNIQMDQQPPQLFVLQCHENTLSDDAFVQSVSEAALLEIQNQQGGSENTTLSHLFSADRRPATLIPVAINEITLPQQVRQLKVWSEDNENLPLNLAIQIRAAKSFQFSEQSYLARLHDMSKEQIFNQFVVDTTTTQELSSPTEQQLQNEWIPLKRFLTRLYRHYKSSVAEEMPVNFLAEQSQLQNWKDQAKQAEQQQLWTEALSYWARVVEGSQGQVRDRAQLSQAAILARLSENYLAQRLWRYLSLYAQADIAEQAENQLLSLYRQQQDSAAIQMLAAARFIHRPNQKGLHVLIEALIQNQQYRFVLLLGLMDSELPLELMLKAAYQLQWWQTYQQLLIQLPQKRQWFWTGLKAQKNGNYQTAQDNWEKSGSDNWLLQLQKGMAIRSQLSGNQAYSQVYNDWSQWQQMHPGERVWQDAAGYVRDSFGTDQYYAVERDLYSKAFRGTTRRPVSMQVMGPVKLSFKIRVLHDGPDTQLDGWLQINDNQESFRYPFSNSKVLPGLVLTGAGDYLPGNLITVEYQVGQGLHEIELLSEEAPISVSISEQQAELPLTVLAQFQLDTFLYALSPNDMTENQLKKLIPVQPSKSIAISNKNLTLKALLELPEVEDARQAEIRMIQCLAVMEREQENRAPVLFVAEQLHQRFPDNRIVQAMWNRIARYSQWQTANSIASSGGLRFIDTQGWQTASPALGVRRALISQANPDEHVVFADQRLLMIMTNLEARTVHVEALLDDLPFLPDSPAQLQYQIDNRKPQQLAIKRAEGWKKFVLQVPAGYYQIRFSVINPVGNQFIKLHFQDDVSDMSVSQERSFFVSTRLDPLQLYVKGPSLIRIDEWLDGKITSRFQNVTEDWQLITIPPGEKQQESLLKIWQRVAIDEAKPVMARTVERKLKEVPPSLTVQLKAKSLSESEMIEDDFELDKQTFGTWSLATDSIRRNNDEEDSSSGNPENFQQFRVDHRYFDEVRNSYWHTLGFVRARQHGNPSFGVKESVTVLPDEWPFAINLEAKAISQVVDHDPEWLGQFKIALSQSAHLTPKTTVIPKLSWFGRYMSLRNSGKVIKDSSFKDEDTISRVDQDLYTAYKAQHTTGLAASMLLTHDPWLDTRWTAKFKSFSNEDMNFFNPDHMSTEAHWKQLLGDVTLDTSYRIDLYQKDKDRKSSSNRQFTQLELNWQSWTKSQDRLEINAQYKYDIDKKVHLGMLSFIYHFSEDRGYRDFKPGEIDFRNIRERQRLDE